LLQLIKKIFKNFKLFKMERAFKKFLKTLQKHYWKIYQIENLLNDGLEICKTTSHSRLRCSETRDFLLNIFLNTGKEQPYMMSEEKDRQRIMSRTKYTQISKERWNDFSSPNEIIKLRIISMNGDSYPDHTFLILKVGNTQFLIQSFYNEYILSGKYGLLELTDEDVVLLDNILARYNRMQKNQSLKSGLWIPDNEDAIHNNNEKYQYFTGIDNFSFANYRTIGGVKNIYNEYFLEFATQDFINRLDYKFRNMFDLFEDRLFYFGKFDVYNFTSKQIEDYLKNSEYGFFFDYRIYDTFLDESLCNYNGEINGDKFQKLTGIHKNVLQGVKCTKGVIHIKKNIHLTYDSVKKMILDVVNSIPSASKIISQSPKSKSVSRSLSTSFGK
jgi:hypothetical protein